MKDYDIKYHGKFVKDMKFEELREAFVELYIFNQNLLPKPLVEPEDLQRRHNDRIRNARSA